MRLMHLVTWLALSAACFAADNAGPLNIKSGLWEVTDVTALPGDVPVPAGLLEKLTPEQRGRIDERMNATPAQSSAHARKVCVTSEQIKHGPTFGETSPSCKRRITTLSSNKLEMQLECVKSGGAKQGGILTMEALGTKNIKGSMQMNVAGKDQTTNAASTFTAKWIGPCTD